jgi:hypothetical protein
MLLTLSGVQEAAATVLLLGLYKAEMIKMLFVCRTRPSTAGQRLPSSAFLSIWFISAFGCSSALSNSQTSCASDGGGKKPSCFAERIISLYLHLSIFSCFSSTH